jgi:hypothetical protein
MMMLLETILTRCDAQRLLWVFAESALMPEVNNFVARYVFSSFSTTVLLGVGHHILILCKGKILEVER